MGVLTGCKPRKEVLKGDLDDAIFAADFGDLISGKAPNVYGDAKTFFQNTHPAKQLCKVMEAVFGRLANVKEGGATIRLSTGFGGGKSHTLMALWHLGRHIDDASLGTDLLPAAGRPKTVTVAAVDASKAGDLVFAEHGKVKVRSLGGNWPGSSARRRLGRHWEKRTTPSANQTSAKWNKGGSPGNDAAGRDGRRVQCQGGA